MNQNQPQPSAASAPLREIINGLTGQIIDTAMHVHREVGPGLLERRRS